MSGLCFLGIFVRPSDTPGQELVMPFIGEEAEVQ